MASAQLLLQPGDGPGLAQLFQLMALLLLTVAVGATLVALLVLSHTFFPRLVKRARQTVEATPGRSFVVGLVNLLFFTLLALALASGGGLLALLAGLLAGALLGLISLGLAAVALLAGSRLRHEDGDPARVALGASLLWLAALVPFAGWFVVAPLSIVMGLGAVVMALLRRGEKVPAASSAEGDLP